MITDVEKRLDDLEFQYRVLADDYKSLWSYYHDLESLIKRLIKENKE